MATQVAFTARLENGQVVWDGPDGKPAKDHRIAIAKFAPPELIHVSIKSDQSVKPLALQIDSATPLHVSIDNGACPSAGIDTDQITLVQQGGDQLIMKNLNTGDPCTLRYQVNVVDSDGNPHPCDPILQNGGAGPGNFT